MAKVASKDVTKGKAPIDPVSAKAEKDAVVTAENHALIPQIKARAMSKDIGPAVIASLAQAYIDETKARELMQGAQSKAYHSLARLTEGIVKAVKNDGSIVLRAAFVGGKDGAQDMAHLNDQLGIALGFREIITVGTGDKAKQRVVYATSCSQYFPKPGENKESEEYKQKNTIRSNFLHMLKKCVQAADAIITQQVDVKMDKTAGTLLLSGPSIKKQFGQNSVLLDEKKNIIDKAGNKVELKERPSFTAMAAQAAAAHGRPIHRGSNTRGAGVQMSNPGQALDGLCKAFVAAIERVSKPSPAQIVTVKTVESAIDAWLTTWDK